MRSHFLFVPPVPDSEDDPATREVVKGCHLLGQPDRVPLRHEGDPGSELQTGGRGRHRTQRDERIERSPVPLRERGSVGDPAPRRLPGDRNMRMLRKEQRFKPGLLGRPPRFNRLQGLCQSGRGKVRSPCQGR